MEVTEGVSVGDGVVLTWCSSPAKRPWSERASVTDTRHYNAVTVFHLETLCTVGYVRPAKDGFVSPFPNTRLQIVPSAEAMIELSDSESSKSPSLLPLS